MRAKKLWPGIAQVLIINCPETCTEPQPVDLHTHVRKPFANQGCELNVECECLCARSVLRSVLCIRMVRIIINPFRSKRPRAHSPRNESANKRTSVHITSISTRIQPTHRNRTPPIRSRMYIICADFAALYSILYYIIYYMKPLRVN